MSVVGVRTGHDGCHRFSTFSSCFSTISNVALVPVASGLRYLGLELLDPPSPREFYEGLFLQLSRFKTEAPARLLELSPQLVRVSLSELDQITTSREVGSGKGNLAFYGQKLLDVGPVPILRDRDLGGFPVEFGIQVAGLGRFRGDPQVDDHVSGVGIRTRLLRHVRSQVTEPFVVRLQGPIDLAEETTARGSRRGGGWLMGVASRARVSPMSAANEPRTTRAISCMGRPTVSLDTDGSFHSLRMCQPAGRATYSMQVVAPLRLMALSPTLQSFSDG